jgi:hypothetical protein
LVWREEHAVAIVDIDDAILPEDLLDSTRNSVPTLVSAI